MNRTELISTVLGFVTVGSLLAGAHMFFEPVRIVGGSMRPALHSGDVALVARRAEPRVGDIALIDEPGHGPVLHRVVDEDGEGRLHTKGDANPAEDLRPAAVESVRGRVIAVIPLGDVFERWRR